MDPSGFVLPFVLTLVAVLIWVVAVTPLRCVPQMIRAYWCVLRAGRAPERDFAVPGRRQEAWPKRLLIAALLGAGLFGVSLFPSTIHFDHDRWPPTPAEEALIAHYGSLGRDMTTAVAGFPWRGVEGSHSWSPGPSLARTAHAMWFNYACFLLIGTLVAWYLPRRWLTAALLVASCLALTGGREGMRWLCAFRD